MRETKLITARGSGQWGKRYDFVLSVRTATRWNSTGDRTDSVVHFDIMVDDPTVGLRRFGTETERAAFIADTFRDVVTVPVDQRVEEEVQHPLAELVGEELAQVVFVRDYVQLNFDGPPLSLLVWPRISRSGTVLRRSDRGYADALVDLIGLRLSEVDEILDLGLVLRFAETARLSMPLDGSEAKGPELAMFDGAESGLMVWSSGDELVAWEPERLVVIGAY